VAQAEDGAEDQGGGPEAEGTGLLRCREAEDFKLVVASTDKIYAAFFSW